MTYTARNQETIKRDELADLLADAIYRYTGVTTSSSKSIADELIAEGYGKRETVTEWAAAFPLTGSIYNYHRTREEAQAFVDGMRGSSTDMIVMTREVLPASASEWREYVA